MTVTAPASEAMRPARLGTLAAELGVLCLALGTTAGFSRLFVGWEFLSRLAPLVVGAWAAALVLRRVQAPVRLALPLHLAMGTVAITVAFAPGTHFLGLPTASTARFVATEIESSFAAFSRLVAPVPVSTGFLVVIAAALWVFAFFADTAALRYRGVVQAAVPHTAAFLAVGVLARESARVDSARWFGLGLALYASGQVVRLATERRWVRGQARRGSRAVVLQAAAVALVALVAGAVLGPALPGSTAPVVDLRELGRGEGPRTVVSPFVGIRSLLGGRSDQVVFTVEADEPAYWRLTALEQFDETREIWVSSGTYSDAGGSLPRTTSAEVGGTSLLQEFSVEGLSGLWLPGAYVPERIRTDEPVSFDSRSASIILGEGEDPEDLDYTLESRLPDFSSLRRGAAGRRVDPRIDEVHLEGPEPSAEVRAALAPVLQGASQPYQQMLFLQDWFRSGFAYDETVDYSNEVDPLAAFVRDRRGFCQQFSSAFALIARWLGLPSRVAVGFTQGDREVVEGDDGTPMERYVVRGRHAHAWPEVHFPGVGWVPFEPTPGRGDPQSVGHTGVAPAQAPPPEQGATTTTAAPPAAEDPPPSSAAPTTTAAPATQDGQDPERPEADPTGSEGPQRGWVPFAVAAALVAGLLAAAWAVTVHRRRLHRRRPGVPADRQEVADAWRRAERGLSRLGLHALASETPMEFTSRAARELVERSGPAEDGTPGMLPAEVSDALDRLGRIETRARFGAGSLDAEEVDSASAAAAVIADYSSSERRNRSRAREPALLK